MLFRSGLVPDDWDGDTIVVPVSAKERTGIEDVLEAVLLVSDSTEIKANPEGKVLGTVIEAEVDKSRGVVSTMLVQNGTLRVGDVVMTNATCGKVRAMFDFQGRKVEEAIALRYDLKRRIMQDIIPREFKHSGKQDIIRFVDWILKLPEEQEDRLTDELEQEFGGKRMPYVTSWERRGIKKGEQKGRIAEKQEVLARQLDRKFSLTEQEREFIFATADSQKLDRALDEIIVADTKEDVLGLLG